MKGYRKILIAVNGSTEVLKEGIKLAQDEKTWITVLKVIPPVDGDLNLTGIKNIGDVLDSGAQAALRGIRATVNAEGAMVKTRLEAGEPHQTIIDVAAEVRCDLIILGSKKKKGMLERLFGDHVIEKVISSAPCPVFVVGA